MIHTVIFDVGGTLVHARSIFDSLAARLTVEANGELATFQKARFLELYRDENPKNFLMVREIIAIILRESARKFGVADLSAEAHNLYSQTYIDNAELFDDVRPVLKKLREIGCKMIVASDADADVLERELNKFDIKSYFGHVVVSSDIGAYKPFDKMVEAIKAVCDRPFSDILFVGDNRVDVLAARKMSARPVLIGRNGAFPIDAEFQITGLDEIIELIENINKGEL